MDKNSILNILKSKEIRKKNKNFQNKELYFKVRLTKPNINQNSKRIRLKMERRNQNSSENISEKNTFKK